MQHKQTMVPNKEHHLDRLHHSWTSRRAPERDQELGEAAETCRRPHPLGKARSNLHCLHLWKEIEGHRIVESRRSSPKNTSEQRELDCHRGCHQRREGASPRPQPPTGAPAVARYHRPVPTGGLWCAGSRQFWCAGNRHFPTTTSDRSCRKETRQRRNDGRRRNPSPRMNMTTMAWPLTSSASLLL
jgi:hypothetical protein